MDMVTVRVLHPFLWVRGVRMLTIVQRQVASCEVDTGLFCCIEIQVCTEECV